VLVNLAGFAQRPEADYRCRYYYWRSGLKSFLLQVGGIIAQLATFKLSESQDDLFLPLERAHQWILLGFFIMLYLNRLFSPGG
jgi:hypothetical protein